MRVTGKAAALATMSLLALAPAAQAAAGFPDLSFGGDGFSHLDDPAENNEQLQDLVLLPGGKILGAGFRGGSNGFLLARVNPDGTPDAGFGIGGISVEPDTNAKAAPRSISEIELRLDGKIVAGGLGRNAELKNAFEFARYLPSGELDPEFGTGGLTMVPVMPSGSAGAIALAPDGKVVGVGQNGEEKEAAVVRLTEGGDPDASFNVLPIGVRTVDVPGSPSDNPHAVEVLKDGTILLGGGASGKGAFLAELDSGGMPVAGFGAAGIAVHDFNSGAPGPGIIDDLEVLGDGRILGTGEYGSSADNKVFVARFTTSGDLDPSFGAGGVFRSDPSEGHDESRALTILPDGRILVAGQRGETGPGTGDTWLLRLTADGQPDPSFGAGGEASVSGGLGRDRANAVALQPDGRAVITGFADEPGGRLLLFGRFTADDPVPDAPDDGRPSPPRCRGRVATIVGTPRNDRLGGTARADVIVALAGNDKVHSRGGNDVICGGPGAEVIKAGKGKDTLVGGTWRDILVGGPGPDLLLGGVGGDRLYGGPGPDRLLAGAGNDRLVGGAGRRDLCNGGKGPRDRVRGGCERRRRIP